MVEDKVVTAARNRPRDSRHPPPIDEFVANEFGAFELGENEGQKLF